MSNGQFSSRVIAITGAGSGIGRGLSLELARRGADLALSDVNEEGLAETARRAKLLGREVHTATVDVADRGRVYAWADEVFAHFDGRVDGIVNNAGVALGGEFLEVSDEDIDWLLGINLFGVIHGTRAFLPRLVERGDGWVVNISSVFGMVGMPGNSAYNIAKFGVRGLTECLWAELRDTGVAACSVHPGGIKTNIVRSARMGENVEDPPDREETARTFEEKLARTTAEGAGRIIADGMAARKRRILVGPDAFVIAGLQQSMPTAYHDAMARLFGGIGGRRRKR